MATELIVLCVFSGIVLFGAAYCLGRAVNTAAGFAIGTPPTRQERQEVERADCRKLISLERQYAPNADSVDPEMTLMRLADGRIAKLHCDLPPDLQPTDLKD